MFIVFRGQSAPLKGSMSWVLALSLMCSACLTDDEVGAPQSDGPDAASVDMGSDGGPVQPDPVDGGPPSTDSRPDGALPEDAEVEPEPDSGPPLPEGTVCFDDPLEVVAEGEGFVVTGPHYRLYVEQDREGAERAGRMLEAAWSTFEIFFGVSPTLESDEKLEVEIYATHEGWVAGMAEDGLEAPGPPAGGYFDHGVRKAYLYVQPTVYYTDVLTLHEAGHQYHLLGRGGRNSLPMWYGEGLAEYIGRHDWDGRCLRTGVRPLLSQEDFPAQALNQIEADGLDLTAIIEGEIEPTRPVAWAIFGFMEDGMEGALAEGFGAFRVALDGGTEDTPAAVFGREIGDPASLEAPLLQWLREAQLLMSPVYREWTHLRPDALWGHGANFTFSHFRAPLDALSTNITPGPAPWGVGVIIEYLDNANYTGVVLFDTGTVSTFEMNDGSAIWWEQGEVPLGADLPHIPVDVSRTDAGQVTVRFGETAFSFEVTLPPIWGVVVNDSEAYFEQIRWRSQE